MTAALRPHLVVLSFWLVIILLAAFFLRQACSLCRANMPSWKRAIVSVILVTFLGYLIFDYTGYLIMRSLNGVTLVVPPWYGYNFWFREPLGLKWLIISQVGPVRWLPIVFALCGAGILQVFVLEAEVTFHWAFFIFMLQTVATYISAYILSLVFGSVLQSAGWTIQGEPVTAAAANQQQAANPATAAGRSRESRTKARSVAKGSKQNKDQSAQETAATGAPQNEQFSLELLKKKAEGAAESSGEYAKTATSNIKEYADSILDQLDEDLAPVTNHLPEPAQEFLAKGGWWLVLGVCAVIVLLWLRSLLRRLVHGVRRPKKKKRKMKKVGFKLKENLSWIGQGFTEEGPQQFTVNGLPAHLRLIILSMGNRSGGDLSEDMADRVLDWIKDDSAKVAAYDQPGVRLWPPFYSADGFATNLASNVPIPEPPGRKSHWVLVAGRVKMGRAIINVGLAFYTDEATSLRLIKLRGENWLKVVGVTNTGTLAGAR
jgi:hypothetical protein